MTTPITNKMKRNNIWILVVFGIGVFVWATWTPDPPQLLPSLNRNETCLTPCVNGDCLADRCYCRKGFHGLRCELGRQPTCFRMDPTQCLEYTELYGTTRVLDASLWDKSQAWELAIWKSNKEPEVGDRVNQHHGWFNHFDTVRELLNNGQRLGHVLEMGAGPYTQSMWMLDTLDHATLDSITLVDPLIPKYLLLPGVRYTENTYDLREVILIVSKGEIIKDFVHANSFDTVVMINTLEHCTNAWQVLQGVYSVLKRGGLLIFNEHTFDHLGFFMETGHPIKIRSGILDEFFRNFEILYERRYDRDGDYKQFDRAGRYVIARKL